MGEKLQRYSKDCHRIMRGDHVVGLVEALANGRWILCSRDGERLGAKGKTFHRPSDALAYFTQEYGDVTP